MIFEPVPTRHETIRHSALLAGDPRISILAFLAVVVGTFLVSSGIGLLVIFAYMILLARFGGLPSTTLVSTLRNLSFFLALIVVVNGYFVPGRPLPGLLRFLSFEGLSSGVFFALRVVVLIYSVTVFLGITSQEALARGLSGIISPFSRSLAQRVALYGFLCLGFYPLFADEVRRIQVAQRFRGGGLGGGLRERLIGVRLLLVPVIVSAIQRSGHLAMAVEVRNIRSTIHHLLVLGPPRFNDFLFAVITLSVLMVALLIRS